MSRPFAAISYKESFDETIMLSERSFNFANANPVLYGAIIVFIAGRSKPV